MKLSCIIAFIACFNPFIYTQNRDTIILDNPSFEDTAGCCQPPQYWTDCGFKGETPPDVQPALNMDNKPFFNVTKNPYDGNTYMGMVVRENDTYESVTQKLNKSLKKGKCYSFNLMLCRSLSYLSSNRFSGDMKEFTTPAILSLRGGELICEKKELLAASPIIVNSEWKNYEFYFVAKSEIKYLILEAIYDTNLNYPYNGNILIDYASAIIEIECK